MPAYLELVAALASVLVPVLGAQTYWVVRRSTGSTSGSTASRTRSSRSTASASRGWKRASRRNRRTPRVGHRR